MNIDIYKYKIEIVLELLVFVEKQTRTINLVHESLLGRRGVKRHAVLLRSNGHDARIKTVRYTFAQ